jgi:Tol biopolymer transport system component
VIIFGAARFGLLRVPAAGGSPAPVTDLDHNALEAAHLDPWFLPDGHRFFYTARTLNGNTGRVYIGDLNSKERREAFAADSNVAYTRPGYIVFARGRTLMAQPFDSDRAVTRGDAVPIAENVDYYGNASQAQFSVSQNGVLTYTSGGGGEMAQLMWFDRAGTQLGTIGPQGDIEWAAISPDGASVAYDLRDPNTGRFDIWVHEIAAKTDSRFTFGEGSNRFPVWSADGSRIAYTHQRVGDAGIYQRAVSGTGQSEDLDKRTLRRALDWSRDGRYLIEESAGDSKTGYDIWVLPLSGDRKAYPFVNTEFAEQQAKLSPDSKWIAYRSDESKRPDIYVETFPTRGGKWQISQNGGLFPRWSRDGKELYYIGLDWKLMAVEIKGGPKFERGTPKPLFTTRLPVNSWFDVSKDGRFLIPTEVEQRGSVPITVVVNWTEALKK